MQKWSARFLLVVGQRAEISPVLQVGAISTEVTVATEAAPLVSTVDATISRNLERERIEQLPENGRSVANLVMMASPGLFNGQDGGSNPINTGLRDAVELYQDGAVIKNRDVGDWSGRLPGVDSVEELRVETSMSSAQFNRPGSVILSTKSGTNTVHGSAFETNRNSGMGVARARQDFYLKPPHYVRNEFGASLGGPVYIPKVYNGKNKTFFFVSYEGAHAQRFDLEHVGADRRHAEWRLQRFGGCPGAADHDLRSAVHRGGADLDSHAIPGQHYPRGA
jgi:hypothetical protein